MLLLCHVIFIVGIWKVSTLDKAPTQHVLYKLTVNCYI